MSKVLNKSKEILEMLSPDDWDDCEPVNERLVKDIFGQEYEAEPPTAQASQGTPQRQFTQIEYNKAMVELIDYIKDLHIKANVTRDKVFMEPGRKFDRIWTEDNQKIIWCFVDKTNGDVLKPATWKAPAKHARGNIFDRQSWSKFEWTGPQYLRG